MIVSCDNCISLFFCNCICNLIFYYFINLLLYILIMTTSNIFIAWAISILSYISLTNCPWSISTTALLFCTIPLILRYQNLQFPNNFKIFVNSKRQGSRCRNIFVKQFYFSFIKNCHFIISQIKEKTFERFKMILFPYHQFLQK